MDLEKPRTLQCLRVTLSLSSSAPKDPRDGFHNRLSHTGGPVFLGSVFHIIICSPSSLPSVKGVSAIPPPQPVTTLLHSPAWKTAAVCSCCFTLALLLRLSSESFRYLGASSNEPDIPPGLLLLPVLT